VISVAPKLAPALSSLLLSFSESLEEPKSFRRDLQLKAGKVVSPDIRKEIDDWLTELSQRQTELPD
jgi:hypothetical protein